MENIPSHSPLRSSKRIRKNYKTLQPFNVSDFEISSSKKTKKIQNSHAKNKKNSLFQPFQNILNYPKPIQGIIKLKSQLSMLDINTISSVIQTPNPMDFELEMSKIQKVSCEQENMIKMLEKSFTPNKDVSPTKESIVFSPEQIHQFDVQTNDTSDQVLSLRQTTQSQFQLKKQLLSINIDMPEKQPLQEQQIDQNMQNLKRQIISGQQQIEPQNLKQKTHKPINHHSRLYTSGLYQDFQSPNHKKNDLYNNNLKQEYFFQSEQVQIEEQTQQQDDFLCDKSQYSGSSFQKHNYQPQSSLKSNFPDQYEQNLISNLFTPQKEMKQNQEETISQQSTVQQFKKDAFSEISDFMDFSYNFKKNDAFGDDEFFTQDKNLRKYQQKLEDFDNLLSLEY